VLLIVDEFSPIASGERVARLVEIVRSYGASLVLAPQAYNAAHTILLHSVPEPEALIRAAGTRIEIEASVQHDQGPLARARIGTRAAPAQGLADRGPSERPGMCFVIGSGMAQKVQVAPAPSGPRRARPPELPVNPGGASKDRLEDRLRRG